MAANERIEEEGLLRRVTSAGSANHEDVEYELEDLEEDTIHTSVPTRKPKWLLRPRNRGHRRGGSGPTLLGLNTPRRRRFLYCRMLQLATLAPYLIFAAVLICGVFYPSYSNPPETYLDLRQRVEEFGQTANVNNEKVYIAASLYDHEGEVVSGHWGQSVLQLIDILGPENVFLSIYENDPDEQALAALDSFQQNVTCQSSIVTEDLDLNQLPHVSTQDGTLRLKRIAFLADVRNRALRPLENSTSPAYTTRFDKLLYLNDVVFDPIDAANLLFSTNVDDLTGKTDYRAACAVDFINPFKFYDTYATRDLAGYNMGVPFYPWFTSAGNAESRSDVLLQKDAVRVKSCWGGMVAFDAKYFQSQKAVEEASSASFNSLAQAMHLDFHHGLRDSDKDSAPFSNSSLRFRSETDTYWDASECCLIHADLSAIDPSSLPVNETGIYMNPYVRVAYSSDVLPWLSFTKRFERLYTPIHTIINWIGDRPSYNPRQFQEPGEEVVDRVWMWDEESLAAIRTGVSLSSTNLRGHFQEVHRTALPGGFCGLRKLSYINEHPLEGEKKWMDEPVPMARR